MSLRVTLFIIAVIGIGALGAVFSLGKYNSSKTAADSQKSTVPSDNYVADLAKALTKKDVVLFCSSQSVDCTSQKKIFGAAATKLDYVECSPSGSNANSLLNASASSGVGKQITTSRLSKGAATG